MTYNKGSERSFAALATGRVWPNLEVLELNGLNLDAITMRNVLSTLTNLRALKITDTRGLTDEVLGIVDGYPPLPPLEELVLKETPQVTTAGIVEYLDWRDAQRALKVLTLNNTGVPVTSLQEILTKATSLKTMAMQAKITDPFPRQNNIPHLASKTVETLRYEISSDAPSGGFGTPTAGYYGYLAGSILADGLPKLRRLFVHDDTFPDQLSGLPPPNASFAGGHVRSHSGSAGPQQSPASRLMPSGAPPSASTLRRPISRVPTTNRFSSNNPFAPRSEGSGMGPTHMLEVYTKSDEFSKWNFSRVDPLKTPGFSARRPSSSYGLGADISGQGWDPSLARRSVMVGSGAGGFLAVPGLPSPPSAPGLQPQDQWRPHSSGGEARGSRDLWR
jgi:hypothetical protein